MSMLKYFALTIFACGAGACGAGSGVLGVFLQKFAGPGINVSRSISRSVFTDYDAKFIKKLGFRVVRIPFRPEKLITKDMAFKEEISRIRHIYELCKKNSLSVILDAHPEGPWKSFFSTSKGVRVLGVSWKNLLESINFSKDTYLELLNEPNFDRISDWRTSEIYLTKILRSIRPGATLILNSNHFGTDISLTQVKPIPIPNIIYSFHIYYPMKFTHQGANWGTVKKLKDVHDVPWINNGNEAVELRKRIEAVYEWSIRNNVSVVCDEFGVYERGGVNSVDLASYLDFIIAIFDEYDIPWIIWQYRGGFGIVEKKSGKLSVDVALLNALHLNRIRENHEQ